MIETKGVYIDIGRVRGQGIEALLVVPPFHNEAQCYGSCYEPQSVTLFWVQ